MVGGCSSTMRVQESKTWTERDDNRQADRRAIVDIFGLLANNETRRDDTGSGK